jgi:tetratricopeptide (TPR) repeat protein
MKRRRKLRDRARRAGGVLTSLAAAGLAGLTGVGTAVMPHPVAAQGENLINRISNERMNAFEEKLTQDLSSAISRYISKRQFVLAVKVIWNPEVVPIIENPKQSPEQQKLPGFPIFVRAPDSPAAEQGTPPFVRLEVKVLIDETLPEYYERFVRKIVPIVARMDFNRGDQVVVLKETFPVLPKGEEQPPTLSEKDLMQQLGETPPPGQLPPQLPVPQAGVVMPMMVQPSGAFTPQAATSPSEAAQVAYDEGRYQDSLRIVQSGFQRSTTNRERGFYMGMEGSIYYTMGNVEAAKASWRRAITYDPSNMEVHKVLSFLEAPGGPKP